MELSRLQAQAQARTDKLARMAQLQLQALSARSREARPKLLLSMTLHAPKVAISGARWARQAATRATWDAAPSPAPPLRYSRPRCTPNPPLPPKKRWAAPAWCAAPARRTWCALLSPPAPALLLPNPILTPSADEVGGTTLVADLGCFTMDTAPQLAELLTAEEAAIYESFVMRVGALSPPPPPAPASARLCGLRYAGVGASPSPPPQDTHISSHLLSPACFPAVPPHSQLSHHRSDPSLPFTHPAALGTIAHPCPPPASA